MKHVLSFVVAFLMIAGAAVAQEKKEAAKSMSWEGYLVDQMCGKKMVGEKGEAKAARHTKDCALEESCKASGFGLVTGGAYVKFTDATDAKASEFLDKTKMEDHIFVKVTGTMDGEKLAVMSIEQSTPKMKTPATKKSKT